jgi:hypothetical protein
MHPPTPAHITITSVLVLRPSPSTEAQSFTSHSVLMYTLLDLLSDAEERKDLATSQSTDDAVPVEVTADSISENDPASSPIATSSG